MGFFSLIYDSCSSVLYCLSMVLDFFFPLPSTLLPWEYSPWFSKELLQERLPTNRERDGNAGRGERKGAAASDDGMTQKRLVRNSASNVF